MRRTSTTRRTTSSYQRRRPIKRKNHRRFDFRRLIWPSIILVALAGLSFGGYKLLKAPQLKITQIRVIGTKLIDTKKAQADVRSVAAGKNILIFSKNKISQKVLKNRPEIRKLKIGRILPRTVVVRITERQPFMVLETRQVTDAKAATDATQPCPVTFALWLVDAEGTPFHEVNEVPKGLTVVDLPAESKVDIKPGQKLTDSNFVNALTCLKECNTIGYKVSKISVDHVGDLCLNNGSDFYVKLGLPLDIPGKLKDLPRIVQGAEQRGLNLEYIDLSCPGRPAWKIKSANQGSTVPTD